MGLALDIVACIVCGLLSLGVIGFMGFVLCAANMVGKVDEIDEGRGE